MTVLEALKIAKTMKRPIVYITDGYILGTDESFSVLSVITLNDFVDIPRAICGKLNDILFDPAKTAKFQNSEPEMFFTYYDQVVPGIYVNTFEEFKLMTSITKLYERCSGMVRGKEPFTNIQKINTVDPLFASVTSLSANDGMRYYTLSREMTLYLSTFITVHPITKTDIVNLMCFDVDKRSFIAKFEIIKKKTLTIQEYVRYRYL